MRRTTAITPTAAERATAPGPRVVRLRSGAVPDPPELRPDDVVEIDDGDVDVAVRDDVPRVELDVHLGPRVPGHPRRAGGAAASGVLLDGRRARRRRTRPDHGRPGRDPATRPIRSTTPTAQAVGVFSDDTRTQHPGRRRRLHLPEPPRLRRRRRLCAAPRGCLEPGESPIVWKPSVCWQLPIKVDWEAGATAARGRDGAAAGAPRLGAEGETMAWCCTEGDRAYVGDRPVIDSLADEVTAIVGTTVVRRAPTPPRSLTPARFAR